MKKNTIPTLLAAVCFTMLSACGGGRIQSIHSVAVDHNVERPKKMDFTNQASANVDSFGVGGTGILPALVLAGVHHAVIAKPRKAITDGVASHSIAIEQIVPAAFSDELGHCDLFTAAPAGGADATVSLKILQYGVNHMGGAWSSSLLAPTVAVEARVVGRDGHHIRTFKVVGLPSQSSYRIQEQFRDDPELLRTGWNEAAHTAARVLINQLRKAMPPQQAPVAPPVKQS